MELHSEILRPGFRKYPRIIDGDLIRTGHWIGVLNPLDHVEGVTVITGCRIRRGVEGPFAQAYGIDDESISLPMPNGISHECEIHIFGVRPPIGGYHPKEVHVLVQEYDLPGILDDLCC